MSDTAATQGADIPASDTPGRAIFTVRQATEVCQVSRRTITRHIDALREHGAYKDENGAWLLPVEALEAVGLRPGRPAPPDKPSHGPDTGQKQAVGADAQVVTLALDEWQELIEARAERNGLRDQLQRADEAKDEALKSAWAWHEQAQLAQRQLLPGAAPVVDVRDPQPSPSKRRGLFR